MSTKKILIGFLLLGALVIFALATFYIENWQFYVTEGYKLDARFTRALDLNPGDEVRIAGVEVGRVHSITVDPQLAKPVKVGMWIKKDTEIREADIARIRMRSIFGGSFLEIERVDTEAALLGEGDTLSTTRVSAGIAELIERSDVVMDEVEMAVKESRGLIENFSLISARIREGEGTVGKLFVEDDAYEELRAVLRSSSRTMEGVADLTESISKGEGLAGRLIRDEALADQFAAAVSDARSFTGMLEELSRDFPSSSLGRLAGDDEFYYKLDRTLGELEEAITAVSQSRGTVGMLINDPELYHKVNATVDGVQEIINEYREQSPILTFTGAIFGAM